MNNWKEALNLTMFEIKNTNPLRYLLWVSILILLVILMVPSVPGLLDKNNVLPEVFFVFGLIVFPHITKPKVFKSQSLGGGWYASYHIISLNQLPIRNEVIVRSRFLSYVFTILSFIGLFLIGLYLFSPVLRSELSVGNFITFIIMLLSIYLLIGGVQVISEIGANLIINIVVSLGVAVFLVSSLSFFSRDYGLIVWLMMITESYPLLTLILSVLIAFLGVKILLKQAERWMVRIDYFL